MTNDPGIYVSPVHCVSNNLQKTARAVSRMYADVMRPTGLGRSQFAILESLSAQSPLPLAALAERLYMDRTTLTRNLKPLINGGLVRREPSPEDARAVSIVLTREGRAKLRQARRYWQKAQARAVQNFGEAQWMELEAMLRRLRRLV